MPCCRCRCCCCGKEKAAKEGVPWSRKLDGGRAVGEIVDCRREEIALRQGSGDEEALQGVLGVWISPETRGRRPEGGRWAAGCLVGEGQAWALLDGGCGSSLRAWRRSHGGDQGCAGAVALAGGEIRLGLSLG